MPIVPMLRVKIGIIGHIATIASFYGAAGSAAIAYRRSLLISSIRFFHAQARLEIATVDKEFPG